MVLRRVPGARRRLHPGDGAPLQGARAALELSPAPPQLQDVRTASGALRFKGLNVGSSGHHLDGWISIDIRPDDQTFAMDATRHWPFEPGSAEAINSEAFHRSIASLVEAGAYFREAFRDAAPGRGNHALARRTCGVSPQTYLEADPKLTGDPADRTDTPRMITASC